MIEIKDLRDQIKKRMESKPLEFKAVLGRADGTVKAKDNTVYVTLYNGNVLEVYNERLPRAPYKKIVIGYDDRDPSLLQVLRFDNVYDARTGPVVVNHKESHTWFSYDPLDIYAEQFMPLLPRAVGGMTVRVYGGWYVINDVFHIMNTQDVDMSAEAVTSGAEWVNAEIDAAGMITFVHGANKASRELLLPEDVPAVSDGTSYKVLFSAKMYAGLIDFIQSKTDTDIFDPRFTGAASAGGSPPTWAAILGKPSIFPPDTSYTDVLYPRIIIASVAPTVNDDTLDDYKRGDLWLDTIAGIPYTAMDVTAGAAVWSSGGGSGSGGGIDDIHIDGVLSVAAGVASSLITSETERQAWYIYCKNPGTAGTTIIDINLSGVSIFTNQANRPQLAWNDANGWAVSGLPDFTSFVEGDVLTFDIDQIATGAAGLIITPVGIAMGAPPLATAINNVFMNRYLK